MFSSLLNWVQRNEIEREIKNPSFEGLFTIFFECLSYCKGTITNPFEIFMVEVPPEFFSVPEKVKRIPPGAGVDLNLTTFTVAVEVPKAVLCATAAFVNAITVPGLVEVAILITDPFAHPATG
jgi:hypothetical protein